MSGSVAMIRRFAVTVSALVIGAGALVVGTSPASSAPKPGAGTVLSSQDITNRPDTRIAGAGKVIAMTYLSEGPDGALVPVRGTVSIPSVAPRGGDYRMLAWGHGTSGLGDQCTVTDRMGTAGRWDSWFGPWLKAGYVMTATEYAGIGGPGIHPYGDGDVQGKNMLDSVRAARTIVEQYTDHRASRGFVTSGGSQGGQSSLFAGHLAPSYAPDLIPVGITAQSVPTDIAAMLAAVAPGVPPVAVPDYVTYVSYVLAGLKVSRPDIDVDSYLTPLGRKVVEDAKTLCYPNQGRATQGLSVGQLVSKPLAQGPLIPALTAETAVPVSGYPTPILLQQGTFDIVAPIVVTTSFVEAARSNGVTIDYRTYQTAHGLNSTAETSALAWADQRPWPAG